MTEKVRGTSDIKQRGSRAHANILIKLLLVCSIASIVIENTFYLQNYYIVPFDALNYISFVQDYHSFFLLEKFIREID